MPYLPGRSFYYYDHHPSTPKLKETIRRK